MWVAALAAMFAACGPTESIPPTGCDTPKPPANYVPLDRPTAPIVDAALAYNRRDAEAVTWYTALFDSTLFVRWFAGQHPAGHLAASWDYASEVSAFATYVDDPSVLNAHVTFITAASDTTAAPTDSLGDPEGTLRYTLPNASLLICRDPVNYEVSARYTIYVAPRDTVAGRPVWRIIRWKDETN